MKLNLGCGYKKLAGFVNVDLFAECAPDAVVNLEEFPWPWADSSADRVVFNHSLEHLGASVRTFQSIIQELYRVCRGGAEVHVNVPHPRHDDFIDDPTHVRPITPALLSLLSKKLNAEWHRTGASNSPLAHYWNVDFEIKRAEFGLDEAYQARFASGESSVQEIGALSRERNNVVKEIRIVLVAVK